MSEEFSLEKTVINGFNKVIKDEKYNFLYNSILNDIKESERIYLDILENKNDDDSAYKYAIFEHDYFSERIKSFLTHTGLVEELILEERGFSSIDSINFGTHSVNSKLYLGLKIHLVEEGSVYFEIFLEPEQAVLKEISGNLKYYSSLLKELR